MTILLLSEALAQSDNWAAPLAQFGVLGVILMWFMFRTEGRLMAIEKSCDRLAKAILLQVATDPHVHSATKEQARSLMAEIEQKTSP